MNNTKVAYKVASLLWIIWGLIHIFAGVMTVSFILKGDMAAAVGGIADAVDPAVLQMAYPEAAGAVIGQHGFNLLWIGTVTFISAFYIWKAKAAAIFIAALVGGLADVGYFLFMDLGGYVNFMPGTVMTIVSALAVIISFVAYFRSKRQ